MITKGQKINERYEIIRTLGEGGMANVYLAHDIILDRDVAVKILRGDLASDEKFVRRFHREAISASSLSHPNIVEMYDVGEDQGQYYIVMEYVEGKTLKNLIKKRGSLTLEEVIDIMLQLTSAVGCAHSNHIIHRDIKPQNVLIKEDGTVKITDFGIAMASNSNDLTQTNSVMGSVHYLPPEQANGSGATMKSDIYSLGILMFELLTGELPFKGDSAVEIAIKQMKEKIPSVCEINPDIPQSIENIIIKACAKNPKNRYESVVEMHDDLERALNVENKNEKKLEYQFPETELEETKVMPSLKELPIAKKVEVDEEMTQEFVDKKTKKANSRIFKLIIVVALLLIVMIVAIIIFPNFINGKEIKVPDVSLMTIADAEKTLKDLGFTINGEYKEQSSDEIDEGKVIKTMPGSGVTRKKGTEITLVVSTGENKITIENYVGKNFYEVKGMLETYGIRVTSEKKEVENTSDLTEYTIIEQSLEVGSKAGEGDKITLYIPDIITEYPDFVGAGWSVDDITQFCEEYGLVLTIDYQETNEATPGTVIKQSRQSGTKVVSGVTLKITVAKEVVEETPEVEDPIGIEE